MARILMIHFKFSLLASKCYHVEIDFFEQERILELHSNLLCTILPFSLTAGMQTLRSQILSCSSSVTNYHGLSDTAVSFFLLWRPGDPWSGCSRSGV